MGRAERLIAEKDRLMEHHTRIAQNVQTQTRVEMMQRRPLDGSKHGDHDTVTLSSMVVGRCGTFDEMAAIDSVSERVGKV